MEHVGIEVVAVGSYDRAELGIDAHLTEVVGIAQWFGHLTPQVVREVDLTDQVVGEG